MAVAAFITSDPQGGELAARLTRAGHTVRVVERAAGWKAMADAVAGAELVVTLLPAARQVRDAYTGARGILAAAAPDTLCIDLSVADVETVRAIHAAAGPRFVDAPLAVTSDGLRVTVGGEAAARARAEPWLAAMGVRALPCGGPGAGQAAYLCASLHRAVAVLAQAETEALAARLGLPTTALEALLPKAETGATADRLLKDLKLVQLEMRRAGGHLPLATEATALFAEFGQTGTGVEDATAIRRMIRDYIPKELGDDMD
jgi:3-hydroxyisobutyrate dehydrogenase